MSSKYVIRRMVSWPWHAPGGRGGKFETTYLKFNPTEWVADLQDANVFTDQGAAEHIAATQTYSDGKGGSATFEAREVKIVEVAV